MTRNLSKVQPTLLAGRQNRPDPAIFFTEGLDRRMNKTAGSELTVPVLIHNCSNDPFVVVLLFNLTVFTIINAVGWRQLSRFSCLVT